MKANVLTISMPTTPCNRCSYCVSKMTPGPETNRVLFDINIDKAIAYADRLGVSTVLITGKGEPTDNMPLLKELTEKLAEYDFIVELQTKLVTEKDLARLADAELFDIDVFALSTDSMDQLKYATKLVEEYPSALIRVTFNVHDGFFEDFSRHDMLVPMLTSMREDGIRQVTFRQMTIPHNRINTIESDSAAKYIKDSTTLDTYMYIDSIVSQFPIIRVLNFGSTVRDVNGMAVSTMDYCIQDNHTDDTIRSLIYHSDGHMYTSWGSMASIVW